MAILNLNDEESVKKYNEFVRNREHTSAMQDLNWGKVKAEWKKEAIYIEKNGNTLVPIKLYFKGNNAKILIGLAKGKKNYDKRESEKKKDS